MVVPGKINNRPTTLGPGYHPLEEAFLGIRKSWKATSWTYNAGEAKRLHGIDLAETLGNNVTVVH